MNVLTMWFSIVNYYGNSVHGHSGGKIDGPIDGPTYRGGAVGDFFTTPPFYSLILAIPYVLEE
jgi:hypothetical protein